MKLLIGCIAYVIVSFVVACGFGQWCKRNRERDEAIQRRLWEVMDDAEAQAAAECGWPRGGNDG